MRFSIAAVRAGLAGILCLAACSCVVPSARVHARVNVREAGAVADGVAINTDRIQTLIDRLAAEGGGTVVVPAGVFVSGALFFKPGVHLHLERSAVLRATTDMAHFPSRPTRIEGLFVDYTPALINADHCDGFRLTGEGVLDGDGRKVWDEFWRLRRASPDPKNFPNRAFPRARLAFISNSRDVMIEGVTFKDSQFWNLHLYHCRDVIVRGASFRVPDDYRQAPSTDGIDVDSSRDVLIERCEFSVTDDCIAMKGSRGPRAVDNPLSPPVERVRVRDCAFRRGHAAVTLGSEATIVRDVIVEKSRVLGPMAVLNFKLRADTPQIYENIHYRDLVVDSPGGSLLSIQPWGQYIDLQGLPPPRSVVRNISVSTVSGRFGGFGAIRGNPGQTVFGVITLRDIDVRLAKPALDAPNLASLRLENVLVNGAPATP